MLRVETATSFHTVQCEGKFYFLHTIFCSLNILDSSSEKPLLVNIRISVNITGFMGNLRSVAFVHGYRFRNHQLPFDYQKRRPRQDG